MFPGAHALGGFHRVCAIEYKLNIKAVLVAVLLFVLARVIQFEVVPQHYLGLVAARSVRIRHGGGGSIFGKSQENETRTWRGRSWNYRPHDQRRGQCTKPVKHKDASRYAYEPMFNLALGRSRSNQTNKRTPEVLKLLSSDTPKRTSARRPRQRRESLLAT